MPARTKRAGRTSASPGRASIDVGGIAGTFGAGDVGTDAMSEDTVPMEGDVEGKMASGDSLRQPLTYLTAQKPSFWQNLLTKGQAGQQYNQLQTQFDINRSNQALQQNLAAANQQAMMDRLNAEYQLKGGLEKDVFSRNQAEQEAARQRADKAAQEAAMLYNMTVGKDGGTFVNTPLSAASGNYAFGEDAIRRSGYGTAARQAVNANLGSQLGVLEDQARIGYARDNPDLIMQSYGAGLQAPITALDLGERRQKEAELSGANQREVGLGQLANQSKMTENTINTPSNIGGGLVSFPTGYTGTPYAVTPAAEAKTGFVTGPDGKQHAANIPATAPAVTQVRGIGQKKPIAVPSAADLQAVQGGVGATPTPQGNPAQQINTQPVQRPMIAPLAPSISFPNRTNMDRMLDGSDEVYARDRGIDGNVVSPDTKRKLQLIQTLIGSGLLQTNSNSNAWPPR